MGVEEVTLCDMDVMKEDDVHGREDAGCVCGLVDNREVSKGVGGRLVMKDNAIKLKDIELVGGGAERHIEREAMAYENREGDVKNGSLNGELDKEGIMVRDLVMEDCVRIR